MWEKINNSSLLFSKSFIENKQNLSVYSNRIFFHRMYFYFINKGYYRIIINSVINLFITNFMVFFLLFLFNCVDYKGIVMLSNESDLKYFINMDNLFKLNWFFMSVLSLFLFLDILKIISILDDVYIFSNIRKFYNNNLKIRDSELEYLEWNEILEIYRDSVDKEINPYYINSIITIKDNYFIALLDHNVIRPIHLNNLFEWNLIYCIIYSFIDNKEKVSDKLFKQSKTIQHSMRDRLKAVAIMTMVFMPVIIVFITFYNLFNYGEQFYNKPDLFISKNFNRLAKLKFRNYNELSHCFENRMDDLNEKTKKYYLSFKNKILEACLKLIIFVFSSVFITLLILTIINDNILTNLNIVGDRNVLWFIGIFGSLIALARSVINSRSKNNPVDIMEQISELIIIDKNFIENANMRIIRNKFLKNYNFKITQIFTDIFWTFLIPIQMWSMSYDTNYIVNFVKQISKNNTQIGLICTFADFENNSEVDHYESLLQNSEKILFDKKRVFSYDKFIKIYPNCLNLNIKQSTQINVI